ncbi:MAG: FtsX-like permease family protein [Acidimicrobiales bacterium]
MRRVIAAQLRRRIGRNLALLLGIVAAVTSFTVLTGTTEVSRLETVGTVEENFRGAYDILVRPRGATTELEADSDLVRNNFLSGLDGGISLDQYEDIKDTPGVDVAAPIAVLGYQSEPVNVEIPLAPVMDPAQGQQVFRLRTNLVTDRGLSTIPGEVRYAYVTPNQLTDAETSSRYHPELAVLQPYEHLASGERVAVCPEAPYVETSFERDYAHFECFSPEDQREAVVPGLDEPSAGGYVVRLGWPVAYVVAAIDPAQEARLAGLDQAIVEGRYLRASDGLVRTPEPSIELPVLVADELVLDERIEVTVERLPPVANTEMLAGLDSPTLQAQLDRLAGEQVDHQTYDTSYAHQRFLEHVEQLEGGGLGSAFYVLPSRWTVGPVDYGRSDVDHLQPRVVQVPAERWSSEDALFSVFGGWDVPWSAEDTAFRTPEVHDLVPEPGPGGAGDELLPSLAVVGRFDPTLLPAWSELSAVPMETYSPPGVVGWDDRSRELLGDQSLQPSSSPTGYLASPPLLLTTLDALDVLASPDYFTDVDDERPISAIRVRVAGVTGPDAASRERIRLAAEEIAERTGLDVDITIGSSPVPMRVDLASGVFGRPELSLREEWVHKGVAVAILDAVDRKSVVLFGLILVVCCLSLTNAGAAAVRSRRTELGALACLGWSPRALYGAVLGELLVVGLAGGAVAGLLAPVVAHVFAIEIPTSRALAAVGAALVLALLAGLPPARRAARSEPAAAVRPAALGVRRTSQPRRVVGLALTNLLRVPGRTLLGALSLAIGVGALTMVLAATFAFQEVLVGSLLGEAISVEVRGVDYVAVGTVLVLGAFAVGDVLYLNVRERAAEFAALQATGWTGRHLAALVIWEGLLVGLLGSVVGAGVALVAAARFAGHAPAELWATTAAAALGGAGLAALAAVIPARLPARLPVAVLLAEE